MLHGDAIIPDLHITPFSCKLKLFLGHINCHRCNVFSTE